MPSYMYSNLPASIQPGRSYDLLLVGQVTLESGVSLEEVEGGDATSQARPVLQASVRRSKEAFTR